MYGLNTKPFTCPLTVDANDSSRESVKEKLLDLIGRPEFEETLDLNLNCHERFESEGFTGIRVSYGDESDDVVWAWLLVPHGEIDDVPAVICLASSYMTPNWGKDAVAGLAGPEVPDSAEHYGAILAENGFVALCPDYPCAGQRVKPGMKPYDTSDIDERFPDWTRVGMSLWDIGRAIEVIKTLKYVDHSKIGCMGLSQGGEMSVMAGAMYDDIAAVVSVCGWSPWSGRDANGLSASYNYPRLEEYCKPGKNLGWDYDHVAALVAPKPFLSISGVSDPFFPDKEGLYKAEREIKQLYELYDCGDRFECMHLSHGHACSWQAMDASLKWFKRWFEVQGHFGGDNKR